MNAKNSKMNRIMSLLGSQEANIGKIRSELSDIQKEISVNENKLKFIQNFEQFLNMEESEAIVTLEKEDFLKVNGTFKYLFKLSMMECSSKAFKALETTLSEHEKEMVNLKQQELKDIEKLKKMNEEYEMKLSVENSVQDFSSKSIDCLKAEIKHTEDAEILKKLEEELRMKETIKKTMKKKGKKASRKR